MKKIFVLPVAVLLSLFSGCATLQTDVYITAEETDSAGLIADLEQRLVEQDAVLFLQKKVPQENMVALTDICADIDSELNKEFVDKVVESRLLALKGRALLLQGRNADAAKAYKNALKKFDNDVQLNVLGLRLGLVEEIDETKKKYPGVPMMIEDALKAYREGKFDLSSGAFDSAFLEDKGIYEAAYKNIRDMAWERRDVKDVKGVQGIWDKNEMTVTDMLDVAQSYDRFLNFFTAGKKIDSKKLFASMKKQGFFESVSKTEESKITAVREQTLISRTLCARFLWNIEVASNKTDPTKYSKKIRARENARSPVADIDLNSEDFDAVLGVVEKEIMTLSDGMNFNGDKPVSALEFNTSLKKIR